MAVIVLKCIEGARLIGKVLLWWL